MKRLLFVWIYLSRRLCSRPEQDGSVLWILLMKCCLGSQEHQSMLIFSDSKKVILKIAGPSNNEQQRKIDQ